MVFSLFCWAGLLASYSTEGGQVCEVYGLCVVQQATYNLLDANFLEVVDFICSVGCQWVLCRCAIFLCWGLQYADCVSITFEFKKKDARNDTVTQMASMDILLCPVRQWAAVVRRILSYPGANDDTPVSVTLRYGRIKQVTSNDMVNALQAAEACIGEEKLGISK